MEISLIKYCPRTHFSTIYKLMVYRERQEKNYYCNTDFETVLANRMARYYHDFFVVEDFESSRCLGCIYSYNYRVNDSHCTIECVMDVPADEQANTIQMFSLYLFREYPLNRVFIQTEDDNMTKNLLKIGFQKEATLTSSIYYNGEYHNLYILALDREREDLGNDAISTL